MYKRKQSIDNYLYSENFFALVWSSQYNINKDNSTPKSYNILF